MASLLIKLIPLALIDSTSILPLAIVPLFLLLGERRPILRACAFILGIWVSYFLVGALLVFGLDVIFKTLHQWIHRVWTQPSNLELYLQILLGLVMMFFGYRLEYVRRKKVKAMRRRSMSPVKAFLFAAGLNLAGVWGAVPYFAAVDQILREDLSVGSSLWVLAYYNLLFISPLLVLLLLWFFFQEKAQLVFERFNQLMSRWLRRILVALLFGLGLILVIDGVGWLLGHPVLVLNEVLN